MPLVLLVHRPTPLPGPLAGFGTGRQNQGAETLVFAFTFLVLLPTAAWVGPRVATAVDARVGPRGLAGVTATLGALLGLGIVLVRLAGAAGLGDGVAAVLVVAVVWWALAGIAWLRVRGGRPWPVSPRVWLLIVALVLGVALCLTHVKAMEPLGVLVALVLGAAVVLARRRRRGDAVRGRAGAALDALVVVVLLLVVPDLVVFQPEAAARGDVLAALRTGIIQFHQDFLLGPANQVHHGTALLAGASSQYGVASVYLLAGWGTLVPLGYGTFALLDGLVTTLWLAGGYLVLRAAGTARTLAVAAMGVTVVALVLHLAYPVGALPQDGPLRYGLPLGVVLAATAAQRWPRRAGLALAGGLGVVGLASVWSVEAFGATLVVTGVLVLARAWAMPGARTRTVVRGAALVLAACMVAHLVLALLTLVFAGELPHWGEYLAFLREFLTGGLGEITYDVSRWTPGLAIGAVLLTSGLALAAVARRPGWLEAERPALTALTGATAYGAVVLFYWVDRSQDHIIPRVAFPALLVATLWLGVAWRRLEGERERLGLIAGATVAAAVLLGAAWGTVGDRFPRTPLGRALPGGQGLRASIDRLAHPPPLSGPAAITGGALLREAMPGERSSAVLTSPALGTEILLRADRGDRLGLGDPIEASFIAKDRLPQLRRAVGRLSAGDRVLLDALARRQLRALRRDPGLDPLANADEAARLGGSGTGSGGLLLRQIAPLQRWALRELDRRFRLRPVARGAGGLEVVELRPR
jgi:hypothetical protein